MRVCGQWFDTPLRDRIMAAVRQEPNLSRRGALDLPAATPFPAGPRQAPAPHLASHLLGQLARRLPADWEARYGVRPLLLETFIHPDHEGTCNAAASWTPHRPQCRPPGRR